MRKRTYRKDGWPEQEPVRAAFREYIKRFASQSEAASHIGTSTNEISDWKCGNGRIPEWFCEVLGFRKVVSVVYERGVSSFVPTGKRA